jgi:hypothetical protein
MGGANVIVIRSAIQREMPAPGGFVGIRVEGRFIGF